MTAKFDPLKRLGADWDPDCVSHLHSAITVALEEMGWHPCPAIQAAWNAVGVIEKNFGLQE